MHESALHQQLRFAVEQYMAWLTPDTCDTSLVRHCGTRCRSLFVTHL